MDNTRINLIQCLEDILNSSRDADIFTFWFVFWNDDILLIN